MKFKLSSLNCLMPVGIYFIYLMVMHKTAGNYFFAKGSLVAILPTIIIFGCYWKQKKSNLVISRKFSLLCSSFMAILLGLLIVYVSDDTESMLIAGCGIYLVAAFAFAFQSAKLIASKIISDNGTVTNQGHNAHEHQYADLLTKNDHSVNGLNPSDGFVGNVIGSESNDNYESITGYQNPIVNPSSGLPMIGGFSGLDIHGNSFGTNFNEPTNSTDSTRGY